MKKCLLYLVLITTLLFGTAAFTFADDTSAFADATEIELDGSGEGTITEEDPQDVYKIVVPADSSVKLDCDLTWYMEEMDYDIYNVNGVQIVDCYVHWNSSLSRGNETITCYLDPGTYYIVPNKSWWSEGNYDFRLSYEKLKNLDTFYDDAFDSARLISTRMNFTGVLSHGEESDIYKITVDQAGVLKLRFKAYMKECYVKLFDAEGDELSSSSAYWNENIGFSNNLFTWPLEEGSYYIQISPYSGRGKYTMNSSFTSINSSETESNDTLQNADNIKRGKRYNGLVGMDEESDVYKVNLPRKGNMKINIKSYCKGLDIYVYNRFGEEVAHEDMRWDWNDNVGYSKKAYSYELKAGTYYVQLKDDYYSGKYQFSVNQPLAKGKITSIKSPSSKKMKLKWKKVNGADGYQIVYSKSKNFKNKKTITIKSGKTVSKTIAKLQKGKRYYVKVRAYENLNGKKVYGSYSARMGVKVR